MLDLLSGVIGCFVGVLCVSLLFYFLMCWVAARAYEMGWRDRDEGRWIGDEQKKEEVH